MELQMDKIKQLIISGISVVVGMLLPYIFSLAGNAQLLIYIGIFLFLILLLLSVFLIQIVRQRHRVEYSVLIFALNPEGKLLTVTNDFHKRIMIPCGRLKWFQNPYDAAKQFLEEQTGICPDKYESQINRGITKKGFKKPCSAQIEFITKHEQSVNEHYAFIYYIDLQEGEIVTHGARFMTLSELDDLSSDVGLFSDILQRYRIYLNDHFVNLQCG